MHCEVALICLLGITTINALVISRVSFQSNPSEVIAQAHLPLNIEQPSRLLLPPFEDYVGPQLYSNDNYRSEQAVGQSSNEKLPSYEESLYPYEVVNRVLPHVAEPTDFQPLEQQITKAAEDVKNVHQNINDFDHYLQGVAATLAPQNKAKNGVIRITMELVPKLGEVSTSGLAEKELETLLSSLFKAESTVSDSTEQEKYFENRISNMLEEYATASDRHTKVKEFENLLGKESTDNGSAEEEEAFEKFLLNAFEEEDYTEGDNAKELKEAENVLSNIFEKDSVESDNANDFIPKPVQHNDDVEEAATTLDSYVDQFFNAEAREKEDYDDYFNNRFASRLYLNDELFIR